MPQMFFLTLIVNQLYRFRQNGRDFQIQLLAIIIQTKLITTEYTNILSNFQKH